jgi:hypothetical protein
MVVRRALVAADATLGRRRTGVAGLAEMMAGPRGWPPRRRLIAVGATALDAVAAGVPSDVIANPLAHREVPATWWSYPALAATALLGGMVTATYVRTRAGRDVTGRSAGGGLLSLLAIGCPACNKLVVLLVGTSGALHLWAPVQPAGAGDRLDRATGLGAEGQARRRTVLPGAHAAGGGAADAGGP